MIIIGTTVSERTPTVIAAEINQINQQTGKILLINAVEIGRRLKEAKNLLPYGAWGQWLRESVRYSKSTAANLMRLYEEYGPRLSAASAGESLPDFQALGNLTYTQALILLDVPEEAQRISRRTISAMRLCWTQWGKAHSSAAKSC